MSDLILNTDDDILKMLSWDSHVEALVLKVGGKNPANYVCTPKERIDLALTQVTDPIHINALLDARNYIYLNGEDVNNVGRPDYVA